MKKQIVECERVLMEKSFNFSDLRYLYNPMEEFFKRAKEKEITHSDILGDLLNIDGKHSQGSIFLDTFFSDILKIDLEGISEVKVCRERSVRRIVTDGGKRHIDIFIEYKKNGKKCGVIIENKLNGAQYGIKQLEDYYLAIKSENYEDVCVICLHDKTKLKGSTNRIDNHLDPIVLYPLNLSEWLRVSLKNSEKSQETYLTLYAYEILLKNLNINNIMISNADILLNLDEKSFTTIKAIAGAYNSLESNRFRFIEEALKNRWSDMQSSFEKKGYLIIWDSTMLDKYGCKLAVSIYREQNNENFLSLYTDVEENNQSEKGLIEYLDYVRDKSDKYWKDFGFKWYESIDKSRRIFAYPEPKGFHALIDEVVNLKDNIHSYSESEGPSDKKVIV